MFPLEDKRASRRLRLRFGLRYGLLSGVALALGAWALHAVALTTSHAPAVLLPLLPGLLALVLLGGLAGWLASLGESALWAALVWIVGAGAMIWTIGHLAYEVRNVAIWLIDRRFWGLPIYSFGAAARARLLMAAFFVVLCLAILGLLQNYRLEGIAAETDERERLTGRGWLLLLWPLPLVFAAGLAADDLVSSPERRALKLVHEAISTGRTYPGDLFELSLKRGVNYNAIAGVRDQMGERYSLSIGEVSLGAANSVVVVAHFDNGAWIHCRVTADQLLHCSDASPTYVDGLVALLVEGDNPAGCSECTIEVDGARRDSLAAQCQNWGRTPQVTFRAQWGNAVVMGAESPAGECAMECLFQGMNPVRLVTCQDIR